MYKSWSVLCFALITFTFLFFSCASTPKNSSQDEGEIISLGGSKKKSKSYFSSIDSNVLSLIENGSPSSLRQGVSLLHKSASEEYSEQEKTLIFISTKIMQIVWSSEKINWESPQINIQNSYTGAIESAERGIYDYSTGNSDFFTIILPSLVLFSSTSRTDFYSDCQSALEMAFLYKSDSVLLNYLFASLKFKQGEISKAYDYLRECEKSCPDNLEIQIKLSECSYENKDFMQTLDRSEIILQNYSQNLRALELAANASYNLGDLSKAESYIVRLLLIEPENLDYVLFRAKILMDKSDYIRASSLLDVYSRTDTSSKDYLILRTKLQRDWNKNNSAAAETIQKALNFYPDDKEVLLLASQIASNANVSLNGLNAKTLTEKILSEDPENLQAMKICISEMIKSSDWQNAYEMSQIVIQKSADSESLHNHVEICLALNKNQEALEIAKTMYDTNSLDESAQQAYIEVLISTNQKAQASTLIDSLLQGSSSRMKSFLYYEKSLISTNEAEILSNLRSSLTANPRNKDSLFRLYQIYYETQDWRRAQYYLKQVVALDPNDSELLAKNAELDRLLGR